MLILLFYYSTSTAVCGMEADSINPYSGQTSIEVKGSCSVSALQHLVPQGPLTVIWDIYVMWGIWHVAIMSVPNFHVYIPSKRLKVAQKRPSTV